MINVSEELKNAVINEVMPKRMEVTVTDVDNLPKLNWYATEYHGSNWYDLDIEPYTYISLLNLFRFDVDGAINYDYVKQADWIGVSFDLQITNIDPNSSNNCYFRLVYERDGVPDRYTSFPSIFINNYSTPRRVGYRVSAANFIKFTHFRVVNPSTTQNVTARFTISNVKIYMFAGEVASATDYSDIFATETNVSRYVNLGTYGNEHLISQSFEFTESICSEESLKLGLAETSSIELGLFDTVKIPVGCDIDVKMYIGDVEEAFEWDNFIVGESKKESRGGVGACRIKAYDRSARLSQNAYAWYTKYMWGMNLTTSDINDPERFDYSRQIYSTLYNLLKEYRVENQPLYNPDHYASDIYNPAEYRTNERYYKYTNESYVTYKRIIFSKKSYTVEEGCDVISVSEQEQTATVGYWSLMDKFYRGIYLNACVYVDFFLTGGDVLRILANPADLIAIPPGCESFDVYIPYSFGNSSSIIPEGGQFISQVTVIQRKHSYYDVANIVNCWKYLPYYASAAKPTVDDIISVDSSITVRDIVRSICEMCGCFFRLDRKGNPAFLYASEHGLYPENTLYPADDLFPQKSGEMTMPTTYYISAEYAEYQVSKYGGVQVIVNKSGNTGGVCRTEYWQDEDEDNAYVIDDNIFLCDEDAAYNTSELADILDILEEMFGCLDNIQYTPFEADTIGTPFLESGDRFTLLTKNDGFESFIFERTLKGIQALRDYFGARGIQKTPRVRNFEWEQ